MASVSPSPTTTPAQPPAGAHVVCVARGGRAPIQAARLLRDFGAEVTVVADHVADAMEDRILRRGPAVAQLGLEDAPALLASQRHLAIVHEGPLPAALKAALDPRVNRVELSWLGDDQPGSDAGAQAVAGPADVLGEPDREPLWFPSRMGEYIMGANACSMVLLFSLRNRQGAVGELALNDIWAYAAGTNGLLCTPKGIPYHREGRRSPGNGGVYPQRLYRAKDGWIALLCRSRREWQGILAALDHPAWGEQERYQDIIRMAVQYPDEVDPLVEAETVKHSRDELFKRAVANGFPLAPVRSPSEAIDDEYLRRQRFWSDEDDVRLPGRLWRSETWLPGPAVGHSLSPAARPAADAPDLTGLRVLDLSWVWAGPMTGSMLADLGADVIKVEHEKRLDNMRLRGKLPSAIPESQKDVDPRETDPLFHNVNRGKRSLLLDMRHPEGADVFLRLVEQADVVLESFRPHVLDSWGLGFDRLAKVNPRLVLLSLRGLELDESFGPSGLRSYAPITSSLSGVESTIRYPGADGPTGGMAIGISDPVAGWHGMMLLMAALVQARKSGVGGWVRLSQLETLSSVLPEMFLAAQRPDEVAPPEAHSVACEDGDLVIDATPSVWESVVAAASIREGGHKAPGTMATVAEAAKVAGARSYQVAGVAGHADWARRFGRPILGPVSHALTGDEQMYSHGWRLDGRPLLPTRSAPVIGQDTDVVLREWVGMDDAEIARLEHDRVLC